MRAALEDHGGLTVAIKTICCPHCGAKNDVDFDLTGIKNGLLVIDDLAVNFGPRPNGIPEKLAELWNAAIEAGRVKEGEG